MTIRHRVDLARPGAICALTPRGRGVAWRSVDAAVGVLAPIDPALAPSLLDAAPPIDPECAATAPSIDPAGGQGSAEQSASLTPPSASAVGDRYGGIRPPTAVGRVRVRPLQTTRPGGPTSNLSGAPR